MLIFTYNTIMSELKKYVLNHIEVIKHMKDEIMEFNGLVLSEKTKPYFNNFERISIDYAVMEKSDLIKCLPVDIGWNDVGGYNSLADLFEKDQSNNIVKNARYVFVDSNNNIIISESNDKMITTIGVKNMIIVDSKNGLLVCNRDNAQRIKELLKLL